MDITQQRGWKIQSSRGNGNGGLPASRSFGDTLINQPLNTLELHACDDRAGVSAAVRASLASPGPHFVHARMAPGSAPSLGRPDVAPADVARRFREFLSDRSLDAISPPVAVI